MNICLMNHIRCYILKTFTLTQGDKDFLLEISYF